MKTFSVLCKYLAEWEIFVTKVVEKIKTHVLCSVPFYRKSSHLGDNVEKYGGGRVATNDNTLWRMLVECLISKAAHARKNARSYTTNAHRAVCNSFFFFHDKNCLSKSLQYYVVATFPVLYSLKTRRIITYIQQNLQLVFQTIVIFRRGWRRSVEVRCVPL
jgi:hypothetical protein